MPDDNVYLPREPAGDLSRYVVLLEPKARKHREGVSQLIRKIKRKLLYSYAGIMTAGSAGLLLLELLSLLLRKQLLMPEGILSIFFIVSGILAAFWGVCSIALFHHEGLRTRNMVGIGFGVAWIIWNLLFLILVKKLSGIMWMAKWIAWFGCYMNVTISGILLLAWIAAKHRPSYDKDFIIIPGCSISKQGGLLPLLKGRTNRAIRFAWDQERATGKQARYIPTGGQGEDEIMSEGSAMEFYLLSHGAEQYEILSEKASVNTDENMRFSKKIMDAVKPDARACFVTTNYHVLRSGILARQAGIDAEGLASGTKWYFWPNGLARECIAILSMYRWQHLAVLEICIVLAWLAG